MVNSYDLFVIGAGSGGVRSARLAATRGLKVAIAEDTFWGGTCVNVGCIPKKLMMYAAEYRHQFEDSRSYGWGAVEPQFSWQQFIDNKNKEIQRLNRVYLKLLADAGVEVINGRALIVDSSTVRVGADHYSCKRILIAVGSRPTVPAVPGNQYAINSNDAFALERLPASIVIVGGGYIALEFACIFNGLGSNVHIVYRGDELLRGFDIDLRQGIRQQLETQGIRIHLNTEVKAIDPIDGSAKSLRLSLSNGGQLECDKLFYATGRKPRIENLWDEAVPIEVNQNGYLEVDAHFRTSVPGIFALGDAIQTLSLTPVAIVEAIAFVDYICEGSSHPIEYQKVATAVFTIPNLASVGYSEEQLRREQIPAKVYITHFRSLRHTLTSRQEPVLMKLLVSRDTDKLLGAHLIAPEAGDLIQLIAVALQAGATKQHFDATIGVHPTIAEELVTLRQESYCID